jgi:protein-S-isoprenylcysteine O-methyltransferase Ste14
MKTIESPNHLPGENAKPAPSFLAWLASALTIALIVVVQFLPRGDHPILRSGGVLVLLTAGIFIFAPFYLLAKHGGAIAGETYMQANQVVDQGLYAITRHPQYLGYVFLAVGFALISQHWGAFLLAIVSTVCFYLQTKLEERYCVAKFGEPYSEYLERVPRFNIILGLCKIWKGKNNG